MLRRVIGVVIIALVLVLIIWRGKLPHTNRSTIQIGGPQTFTGVLLRTELSLVRRGTHTLRVGSEDILYVESTTVSLRDHEGEEVVLSGEVQKNTDTKALPVLVASNLKPISLPEVRATVSALQLSLSVPQDWEMHAFADGAAFTKGAGSAVVLLKVHKTALLQLPLGQPLIVGSERGVRDSNDGVVYVLHAQSVLSFSPYEELQTDVGTRTFQRILRSVQFADSAASSRASSPATGTGSLGTPCGGAAGILCPAGSFCQITDSVSGSGQCKKLPVQ